jgi:hypothetical protein
MLSCLIGFTLLIASIYMSLDDKKSVVFQRFNRLLDESQKRTYASIVRERLRIYVMGMILGLLLALSYYVKNRKDPYRICKFLCIVYVVKLAFYYLSPKQPLMLYSLTEERQVEAWADIYTHMKQQWATSLIVGFVGYLMIGWGACHLT